MRYDAERDAWLVHRPERSWPMPVGTEPVRVPAVPEVTESDSGGLAARLTPLLGSLGIVAFAFVVRSVIYLVVAGFMVVALVGGTLAAQRASRKRARKRRTRARNDFGARLSAARIEVWQAATVQRDALLGLYPSTSALLATAQDYGALWERRPAHEDFGYVRLGLGDVAPARPLVRDGAETPPGVIVERDLADQLDEALTAAASVPEAPVVIALRDLSSVACVGELARGRDLAGAWLTSLAAACAPTDLRVLALIPPDAAPAWEWSKWLPHLRDPLGGDGFGRGLRSVWTDPVAFSAALRALVEPRLEQRRRAEESGGWVRRPDGPAVAGEHVLLIVDGYDPHQLPAEPHIQLLLADGAQLAVTTVLLVDEPSKVPSACGARIDFGAAGRCTYREAGPRGRVEMNVLADRVDREAGTRLARIMAPLHVADADAAADMVDTVRLVELLGYESADQLDPGVEVLTEAAALVAARETASAAELEALVFGDGLPAGPDHEEGAPRLDRRDLLAAPVGIRSDGAPLVLDLKEAAAGGMGPHGVLVGATGSGKSELLRSLVIGLAARHDPELLNMVLVDFKGGATFAELGRLRHTAGLITNLAEDLSLADRMRVSLAGELDRRQQLLRDAGNLDSVRAYHERRQSDPSLPPLPYLLVVVDEFGELLAARPDFLEVFVAIGRLGRSLGIHLLLATQRLEEGRIRGLESHLRYRICLRTYSAGESSTVIGVPDAFHLPPMPGLGYLRVDTDLVRFKAATTMLPHRPVVRAGPVQAMMRPFSLARPRMMTPREAADTDTAAPPVPEFDALVGRLAAAPSGRARQVWLPPLPDAVTLDELSSYRVPATSGRRPDGGGIAVAVGLLDDPARQQQRPLVLELSGAGGHVACVGGPRTGKTTFLRTFVAALSADRSPAVAAVYVLDLGGGALHDLTSLPHVGAVIGRHDPDGVARMIREIRAVMDERATAFRTCGVSSMEELRRCEAGRALLPDPLAGEVFVLIDGLGVLRHEFPDLDLALADMAGTSLQFGVHLVVTAGRWLDVRPALLDVVGSRIELHLNDPVDSIAGRAVAAAMATDRPGRGLLRDGRQVHVALPPPAVPRRRRAAGPAAPRVLALPERVSEEEVPALAAAAGRPVPMADGLLLGMAEFRLAPVWFDPVAPGQHLLTFGDSGSGRTSMLGRIVDHLAEKPPSQVRLHIVDLARGLLDRADLPHVDRYAFTASLAAELVSDLLTTLFERLPPPELTRQELLDRSWWSGPEHVLVIDDYDLAMVGTSSPFGPLADALGYARDIGFHVVMTRRVAGSARSSFEPFGQRLRELTPTALLLSGDRTEGPLVGERTATGQPPGRGVLVRRGSSDVLLQLVASAESAGTALAREGEVAR